MRFRRVLSVVALAAVSIGTLSACETKVGLAASAAGHRLTDSQLAGYVKAGAKPYTSSNTTVVPKLFALENWVDATLFTAAVERNGGTSTQSERTTARGIVLGSRTADQFESFYGKQGYTPRFAELILGQSTQLVILVRRLAKVSFSQVVAVFQSGQAQGLIVNAVRAAKLHVDVSPRYGAWDPASLSLSPDEGAGAPAFITYPGATTTDDIPVTP